MRLWICKQCRPRTDCSCGAVCSGSALFVVLYQTGPNTQSIYNKGTFSAAQLYPSKLYRANNVIFCLKHHQCFDSIGWWWNIYTKVNWDLIKNGYNIWFYFFIISLNIITSTILFNFIFSLILFIGLGLYLWAHYIKPWIQNEVFESRVLKLHESGYKSHNHFHSESILTWELVNGVF